MTEIKPTIQLVAALVVMFVGAWLIGWWAVGLLLVVFSSAVAADAVLRDEAKRVTTEQPSNEVLERWRRAR